MVTDDELRRIMPTLKADRRALMLPFIQQAMAEFGITSYLREAAFLAQLGHESLDLKFMEEIASGAQYEGRRDLGNTQPGDGKRFKGRGPIQLTGRSNYKRYGDLLGLDLINNPKQAATPEVGFRIAGLFWKSNGLNEFADAQQFKTISIRINGRNKKTGLPNGWDDRLRRYGIAKQVLSKDDAASVAPPPPTVAPPPPTVAPPPPTVADESSASSAFADASGGAAGTPAPAPTEIASSGVNAITNLFSNIANEAASAAGNLFRSGSRAMSGGTSNIPKNLSRGIYPANEENAGAKKSAGKQAAAKKSAKKAATGKGAAKKTAARKGAAKKGSAKKSAKKGAAKASGKAGAKGGSKKSAAAKKGGAKKGGGAKKAAGKSGSKGGAKKGATKKGGGKKGGAKKGGAKKGGSRGMQNLPV